MEEGEEEVLQEGDVEALAEEADEQLAGEERMAIDGDDAEQAQHAQQQTGERWEPSSSEEPAEDAWDLEMLEASDGVLEDAETVASLLR